MKKIYEILCIHITLRNNIKYIRIKFYRILRIKNLQNITYQKFTEYYVSKICKILRIENMRTIIY